MALHHLNGGTMRPYFLRLRAIVYTGAWADAPAGGGVANGRTGGRIEFCGGS
jgi:hypothetical protein